MAFGFLMNDDIFISYYRNDADQYAVSLDKELTDKGYTCFTDDRGTEAGRLPTEELFRKIQGCKLLILLGSQGAVDSDPVAQEVNRFAEANGTSRIVPVSFDKGEPPADWASSGWYKRVEGIKRAKEKKEALKTGEPSKEVIERIEKQFGYAKSKDRLRRYRNRALATLLFLLVAIAFATVYAAKQSAQALDEKRKADEATALANERIDAAQKKLAEAEASATKADEERIKAEKASAEAKRQAELADAATKEAEQRRGVAEAEARKQGEIAAEQRREADRQTEIARARQLIARGELAKTQGTDPFRRPMELALEAWQHHQSFEVDSLLRYGLDKLPPLRATLPHAGGVKDAVFSPDGRKLLTLSGDNKARVWDAATGDEISTLTYDAETNLTLSRDGRYLAVSHPKQSGQNQTVRVLDLTGKPEREVAVLPLDEPVVAVAFSEEGKHLAAGGAKKGVKVWEIVRAESNAGPAAVTLKEVAAIPPDEKGETSELLLSPSGKRLLVKSSMTTKTKKGNDKTLYSFALWNVAPVKKIPLEDAGEYSNRHGRVSLSRDGNLYAQAWREMMTVKRVEPPDNESPTALDKAEDGIIQGFDFDDETLIAYAEDKFAHVYVVDYGKEHGKEEARLAHDGWVTHVSFLTYFGRLYLATVTGDMPTVSKNQVVHLWELYGRKGANEVMRIHHTGEVKSVVFSPAVPLVATVGEDGTVRVWEKMDGGAVSVFHHWGPPNNSFSGNGRYVASVTTSEASVWDISTRQVVSRISGDFGQSGGALSGDGRFLIESDDAWPEQKLWLWDMSTGEARILGPPGSQLLATNRDGQYVATSSDPREVRLWGDYGRRELQPLRLDAERESFSFSPGGELFAVRAKGQAVSVRETLTNQEVVGPEPSKGLVGFSPDETTFAVEGDDHIVRVFKRKKGGRRAAAEFDRFPVPGQVSALIFSPEGNHLGVYCKGGKALLWNSTSKKAFPVEPRGSEVTVVAFGPRGRYFAVGYEDGAALVVKTSDGAKVGDIKRDAPIEKFVFTPDERYLAFSTSAIYSSGDQDDSAALFIWDLGKKETLRITNWGGDFAFDAEGRFLHVVGSDVATILWRPEDVVDEARSRLLAHRPE
ncbi:MAG TPA: TIR domain-containing protein [Pyrinomonadaceae bacterium]|nr:TIR domain-containing protein [Pyrinomonadaceae bacterium]